ncbi:hypothetical protein ACFYO7_14205 [Nocardia salmonicida]|uniref:hypothetical protein n=1 Tax=Nocardia salmonicida TaxID=53431 RepID=UPI0036A290E8
MLEDEQHPKVLESTFPDLVIWTTLWPEHPTARLHFNLPPDSHGGTHLRWTLNVARPDLDISTVGHLRHRINTLINANLRHSFGQ